MCKNCFLAYSKIDHERTKQIAFLEAHPPRVLEEPSYEDAQEDNLGIELHYLPDKKKRKKKPKYAVTNAYDTHIPVKKR